MKSFLSYFLLITLLFPSIVESFHALEDSHTSHEEHFLNFHQEKHNCDLGLYFSLDFNSSESDSDLEKLPVFLLDKNLKKPSNLISNFNLNDINDRGPPRD
tara:strand:+ start:112 stop:414 length:303 start_codon:yes stop_codon:yes gene_type:complete